MPAPALLMGTPPPSARFCQKRPCPPRPSARWDDILINFGFFVYNTSTMMTGGMILCTVLPNLLCFFSPPHLFSAKGLKWMTVLLGSLQAMPFLYWRLRMCMNGWAKSKPQLLRGGLGDGWLQEKFDPQFVTGFQEMDVAGHPSGERASRRAS